jgi:hypothetical protein
MKKTIKKILLIAAGLFLLAVSVSAQKSSTERTDKLVFLNGTTREGKVLAFADENIRFTHSGETLAYEFPKKEIERIEFASGRMELITGRRLADTLSTPVISKSKVAVIPMQYTGYGNEGRKEDMGFYLQEVAIGYLSKSASELKIMDATEVNSILLRKGIIDSSIRRYTPKELAEILHVEYVIMGTVLQDNGTFVTNAIMNKTRRDNHWNDGDHRRRENAQQHVVSNQLVETHVTLSIYNEAGEKIYGKTRQSILSERDAYKNTIHYLLKRTPLYKR